MASSDCNRFVRGSVSTCGSPAEMFMARLADGVSAVGSPPSSLIARYSRSACSYSSVENVQQVFARWGRPRTSRTPGAWTAAPRTAGPRRARRPGAHPACPSGASRPGCAEPPSPCPRAAASASLHARRLRVGDAHLGDRLGGALARTAGTRCVAASISSARSARGHDPGPVAALLWSDCLITRPSSSGLDDLARPSASPGRSARCRGARCSRAATVSDGEPSEFIWSR